MSSVNLKSFAENRKVCIIVPVYNAEKYLGYCLNSILSQTYTNWIAILVDDGSTDASLQICKNYESIDPRFSVISKSNGGVSSARNAGLALAEGDYLAFLDSDDCWANDALEKQVAIAVSSQTQLVVTNVTILDFNNPEDTKINLTSDWLNQSCCFLTAQEFREKRMRLIWFTALLEGPCAKLYNLDLWKKLNLSFPEDVSLGEDFITNLQYYNHCDNIVFLNECCYYYNKFTGSDSLTEKYRPDLFENKMYLMETLENYLGGRKYLSEPELDAFYCYVASSGWQCLEKTALSQELDENQKLERIQIMLNHPLFTESICHATYIPERFICCVESAKQKNYEELLRSIAVSQSQDGQEDSNVDDQLKEEVSANSDSEQSPESATDYIMPPPSGITNRMIRRMIRMMLLLLRTGRCAEKLAQLEKEIEQFGLKNTFYSHSIKKSTKNQLRYRIDLLEEHLNAEIDRLNNHLVILSESEKQTAEQLASSLNQQQRETSKFEQKIVEQVQSYLIKTNEHINERFSAMNTQIRDDVNGYTWTAEQRITKSAYLKEINELRQRKKAIMLATAEHANIGDSAITLAEQQFLSEQFSEYYQIEISTYEFDRKEAYLHAILNSEDILFINGGGNIGDLYLTEEMLHRKIISEFPNHKIIIFPQTISFSNAKSEELTKSAMIYNRHPDLTMFVRGEASLVFAKKYFSQVKSFLMPDMAHVLRSHYAFNRNGILLCLRNDQEGILNDEAKKRILNTVHNRTTTIDSTNNIYNEDISRDLRGVVVRKELMKFASHQVIITDRLHGMIFAAITNTPCVVIASYNHKIREYYDAFYRDSNAVFFIGEDLDRLDNAIKEALHVNQVLYPIFELSPLTNLRKVLME